MAATSAMIWPESIDSAQAFVLDRQHNQRRLAYFATKLSPSGQHEPVEHAVFVRYHIVGKALPLPSGA